MCLLLTITKIRYIRFNPLIVLAICVSWLNRYNVVQFEPGHPGINQGEIINVITYE